MIHYKREILFNTTIRNVDKNPRKSFIHASKLNILRSVFILFLVSMTLYQSIKILSEYFEYRVIKVKDDSEENKNEVLAPAITFCLGDFLSFDVIQQLFPDSNIEFKEIHSAMESTNDSTIYFLQSLRMEKLIKSYQTRAINQMSNYMAFNQSIRMFHSIENCLIVRQNSEHKCDFFQNRIRYIQESQKCSTLLYEYETPNTLELSYGDLIVFIFSKVKMKGLSITGKLYLIVEFK